MPNFANSALGLFHRLFGATSGAEHPHAGVETVLDGHTAVAVTEACIAEVAGLGASFPADAAELAWKLEERRAGVNCFGGALAGQETEGPRGALAAAIGLAMSGTRTTAFLSGPDLMSAQDLLVMAAGRHLPLVVHLSNRALAAQAGALGSGHKAYHASADTGCFVLCAANVQEAVDFTLVARRVTELALIPGLVAMDGEQTALAAQEVHLPPAKLVHGFLGPPQELIAVPTPAQKLLFGETRRRLPRWHNLERPVLHGGLQGPESWALGAVAKHPYFDRHLDAILAESFALLAKHTGRPVGSISSYRMDDARLVLVAQGAAIETAQAIADSVRKVRKIHVGVLGIHCLRPFPGPQIAEQLRKKQAVAVLERVDTPLAADLPLTRQVRATVDRALENAHFGQDTHPDYPAITKREQPRFRSVVYGLGGLPLRGADLMALCVDTALKEKGPSRIYLGIEFAHASSLYPKRQVLLDTLRRDYPEIAKLGLKGYAPSPDARPEGALTVAVHRLSDQGGQGLAVEAAAFLHQLIGGRVRSRPGLFVGRWASYCVDRFTHAPQALRDPGDDIPVDISVIAAAHGHPLMKPAADLCEGGILLALSALGNEALWQTFPLSLRADIQRKHATLYGVPPLDSSKQAEGLHGLDLSNERLLGSLFGTLLDSGRLALKARRVLSVREDVLRALSSAEREARLAAFKAGLDGVRRVDYASLPAPGEDASSVWDDEAPLAVRHLGRTDEAYDSLPRFWDQVGVLYRNGEAEELTPDPYLATGIVPPLSATLRDHSDGREMLPAFDPAVCSGCGQCWTRCPDTAIGAAALSASALIDTGIRLAGGDALRMAATKLASRVHSLSQGADAVPASVAEWLDEAFAWLKKKMPLADERKLAMKEAFAALREKIGPLPVARTEPFFHEPERQNPGSGELLSLAINPDTCKGCGLCITACEPQALSAAPQNHERVEQARRLWKLWEQTPDTPEATLERASQHPEVGPMAALLLSRHCLLAVAGGDSAEAGSGEKVLVRLTLATTEFHLQPFINRFLEDIETTRQALTQVIQATLSEALPGDDLDALAGALDTVRSGEVELAAVTSRVEAVAERGRIDATRLRRLVALAQALGDLHERLPRRPHGLGRARLGLAVAPGSVATWAGAFPDNPFQVPVAVDMSGDTAQLAAGLLEGQLRDATESFVLLRKAHLELGHPKEAPRTTLSLDRLTWRDLSADERRLCPYLLLMGNDAVLAGQGLSSVTSLLGADLPVKILVFADLDLGLDAGGLLAAPLSVAKDPKINLGLFALAQRRAYVAQTSLSDTAHFLASLRAAFDFPGPALIHVHGPSPERHGFATDRTFEQAQAAVQGRVFPLFRYDPQGAGVFGSRLSLEGNPDPYEAWVKDAQGRPLTAVDWAVSERRFAPHFEPLKANDPAPLPIADYLELAEQDRQGKTPCVTLESDGSEPARYRVGPALVSVAEERLHAWRTLQELAGLVTPFTAQVKQQAEQQIAEAHQAELAALEQAYEARLRGLREEIGAETAAQIRGRLLTLAGYHDGGGAQQEAGNP